VCVPPARTPHTQGLDGCRATMQAVIINESELSGEALAAPHMLMGWPCYRAMQGHIGEDSLGMSRAAYPLFPTHHGSRPMPPSNGYAAVLL
jgi:hypothetical protein